MAYGPGVKRGTLFLVALFALMGLLIGHVIVAEDSKTPLGGINPDSISVTDTKVYVNDTLALEDGGEVHLSLDHSFPNLFRAYDVTIRSGGEVLEERSNMTRGEDGVGPVSVASGDGFRKLSLTLTLREARESPVSETAKEEKYLKKWIKYDYRSGANIESVDQDFIEAQPLLRVLEGLTAIVLFVVGAWTLHGFSRGRPDEPKTEFESLVRLADHGHHYLRWLRNSLVVALSLTALAVFFSLQYWSYALPLLAPAPRRVLREVYSWGLLAVASVVPLFLGWWALTAHKELREWEQKRKQNPIED
jgi:ABC-type glycerol-3-phosphate transport system permease component